MSTLEYIISLLETMSEDKLKEIQNYIQYIIFRDDETMPFKPLSEEELVEQLTAVHLPGLDRHSWRFCVAPDEKIQRLQKLIF